MVSIFVGSNGYTRKRSNSYLEKLTGGWQIGRVAPPHIQALPNTMITPAQAQAQAATLGNFIAIPGMDNWEAMMLTDAYKAVTKAGCWDLMKTFAEESFMFSSAPWLNEVQTHMTLMDQHSGSSYGITMRIMESIAKDGWDTYVAARIARFEEKQAAAAAT